MTWFWFSIRSAGHLLCARPWGHGCGEVTSALSELMPEREGQVVPQHQIGVLAILRGAGPGILSQVPQGITAETLIQELGHTTLSGPLGTRRAQPEGRWRGATGSRAGERQSSWRRWTLPA